MIYNMIVTNHLGESLKVELGNPEESGFLITSITGLGPGEAEVNTTELAATDGGIFNSSRITSRNIVISITYLMNKTIEETRHLSYKYFPLKKPVILTFETDTHAVMIDGYVESNEPDIFSDQESTQISIVCPDPYFYSLMPQQTVFSGIEPMFEFPFSNESLTERLLVMSEIRVKYENAIFYMGDAETGMLITIHAVGPATGIKIYNVNSRETMSLDTTKIAAIVGSEIKNGDDIIINTVKGKKYCKFVREGKEYNILNALDRNSDWLQLEIGENILAFTADTGNNNLHFTIQNSLLYEGV